MSHPTKKTEVTQNVTSDQEGNPKFGRLLIVLILTVLLLAVITWASEAYWS